MKLSISLRSADIPAAHAVYRRVDFGLEYSQAAATLPPTIQTQIDVALGIRAPRWYALADTLTLTFGGPSRCLTAFDAYTNIDLWIATETLMIPPAIGIVSACVPEWPSEDDRINLGTVPIYRYSKHKRHLRIEFGGNPNRHYRLSNCLVIGMHDDQLVSIDLEQLEVI